MIAIDQFINRVENKIVVGQEVIPPNLVLIKAESGNPFSLSFPTSLIGNLSLGFIGWMPAHAGMTNRIERSRFFELFKANLPTYVRK